jgi:hypothetical protein
MFNVISGITNDLTNIIYANNMFVAMGWSGAILAYNPAIIIGLA